MKMVSEKQMKVLSGAVIGSSLMTNVLVYAGIVAPRTPEAWIIGGILMVLLAILAYVSFTSRGDS